MNLFLLLSSCFGIYSCLLDSPVRETRTPSEFEYNIWLLERLYLYPDEIPEAVVAADTSLIRLYTSLADPYTRYVPKSQSDETITEINTSIIPGDIGVELMLVPASEHPLRIYRVYPQGPAGKAGMLRYSIILSVNGIEFTGDSAYDEYQKVMQSSKELLFTVISGKDTLTYSLLKETIYAPTVFVDTLYGIPFISIREFTPTTADTENGTLGELKSALETTREAKIRILDVRNNPGGYMSQCIGAADLFVKNGILSTRISRQLEGDGSSVTKKIDVYATAGDIGESGRFILLANRNTASCGEIFVAAIHENTETPLLGETTYGKGIGQGTWKTIDSGLAIITNLQLLTPQGTNYHGKGISPDVECAPDFIQCAAEQAQSMNLIPIKKIIRSHPLEVQNSGQIYVFRKPSGGAIY
jgi:C-terminal peptidase prc